MGHLGMRLNLPGHVYTQAPPELSTAIVSIESKASNITVQTPRVSREGITMNAEQNALTAPGKSTHPHSNASQKIARANRVEITTSAQAVKSIGSQWAQIQEGNRVQAALDTVRDRKRRARHKKSLRLVSLHANFRATKVTKANRRTCDYGSIVVVRTRLHTYEKGD